MAKSHGKKFKANTHIMKEGEKSRKMYIIKSGKVRVYKAHYGKKVVLATLGANEIIGEMSFLDGDARSASVETIGEVEAIELDGENPNTNVNDLPGWAKIIFKSTFQRIRDLDQKLTVLESVSDYNKSTTLKTQSIEMVIKESLRIGKLIELVFKEQATEGKLAFDKLMSGIEGIAGKQYLNLETLLSTFEEEGLMSTAEGEGNLKQLDPLKFGVFINYLIQMEEDEKAGKEFMIITRDSLNMLKHIIKESLEGKLETNLPNFDFSFLVDQDTAYKEVAYVGAIDKEGSSVILGMTEFANVLMSQKILRTVSNTVIHVESE